MRRAHFTQLPWGQRARRLRADGENQRPTPKPQSRNMKHLVCEASAALNLRTRASAGCRWLQHRRRGGTLTPLGGTCAATSRVGDSSGSCLFSSLFHLHVSTFKRHENRCGGFPRRKKVRCVSNCEQETGENARAVRAPLQHTHTHTRSLPSRTSP